MVPIPQLTVLIVQGPHIKLFQKFYGCITSLNRSRHGAKASEAVQKIATDEKECRKCSSCVIIC